MKNLTTKTLALAGACAAIVGLTTGASWADPPHHIEVRHDIHRIERNRAQLDRLHAHEAWERSHGHYRAAYRTQGRIDRTRGRLFRDHHELRHDTHHWH